MATAGDIVSLEFNFNSSLNPEGRFEDLQLDTVELNEDALDGLRERLDSAVLHCKEIHKGSTWQDNELVDETIDMPKPDVFLAQALTADQIVSVNDAETRAIAAMSVAMQETVATVPVEESGERLVPIELVMQSYGLEQVTFSDIPFHEACGEYAGKQRVFWVRKSLAEKLAVLEVMLESVGLSMHIEDAFRPEGVQEGLFKRRVEWLRADFPDWEDEQIIQAARTYTAINPRLASHKAGAAIDTRLRDRDSGQLLDIGHDYPVGGALVYLDSPYVTQEQWQNRMILYGLAKAAGLAMYVGEDWHLSSGDNLAGIDRHLQAIPGYVAKHGPIKGINFKNGYGEPSGYYNKDELDKSFD